MSKSIDTLVKDIEEVLLKGTDDVAILDETARELRELTHSRLLSDDTERTVRLWFSNIGHPCTRQLWYRLHKPDTAISPGAPARYKFFYGDLIEAITLGLARLAGHDVREEQTRLEWNGISGRIDGIIDGVLVDVKSASQYSFDKFRRGLGDRDDGFGYLGQLKGYLLAAREAGLIEPENANVAAFLVVNKVTGELCLDSHHFSEEELEAFKEEVEYVKGVTMTPDEAPPRAFASYFDGKSKNKTIPFNCAYCPFRFECWPGLRAFKYASGKVKYLTHVDKVPNLEEVHNVEDLE